MITNNADVIAKELQQYSDEVERKLKAMVAGFAGEVALAASDNTAMASEALVNRWYGIYQARSDSLGIDIAPGFHKGAWQYVEGQIVFDPTIKQRSRVENEVQGEARAMYELGDTFSIAAIGPNYEYLEARDSIGERTTKAVTSAFGANVKQYYDRG
jgi:hypothetical protein